MENTNKSDRINLRVEPNLRELFQSAADLKEKNLSAFILEAARIHAEQELAEQDHFSLSADHFEAFMEALERPARDLPQLRRLLSQPSILEKG